MQNHTTREILTAFQYLLIGFVALVILQQWFSQRPQLWQMGLWIMLAGGLSLVRIFILVFVEWVRGNRWQSIRRRNWD